MPERRGILEHFFLSAAGIPAEVTARYPLTRRLCRDYELPAPDAPVFITVSVSPEEMTRMAASGDLHQPSPAYLEFLCVQDQLASQLPAFGRFLMHGAAIAYNGAAYLFTAPSGTGKSTHIRLWRQYLGSGVSVINGDKPFLSLAEDGTASGAPPGPGRRAGSSPPAPRCGASACWSAAQTASAACLPLRRWRRCSARSTTGTTPRWNTGRWAFWTRCCAPFLSAVFPAV